MPNTKQNASKRRTQSTDKTSVRQKKQAVPSKDQPATKQKQEKRRAQTIGKAIARQREIAKLTQEEVAARLNIGNEAVSRMERGVVIPSIVRLIELAEMFGCNAADFLEKTSSRPVEQASRLEKQLARLNDQDRAMLVEMVETLCERLDQA